MKKCFLIVISLILSVAANAQQAIPDEFFGLKFGNIYSLEEVISHVGDNGNYNKTDDSIEFNSIKWLGYLFDDVTYDGKVYPSMSILNFTSNAFGGIIFKFTNDNIPENQSLESIYNELSKDLSGKYELIDTPNQFPNIISKISMDENGNAVTLSYGKLDKGDMITVAYFSFAALYSDLATTVLPTIQDTFFGLQMGSRQTASTIKSAVGHRGTFLSENSDIYGKSLTFKDITFAGKVWDFGDFCLTENGELYYLRVSISLTDYKPDDLKEANRTYDSFKTKLEEKYGTTEEKSDEDGKSISYIGNNGIGLILSNSRSKSKSGEYRRYVTLEYWHTTIYSHLYNQSNDEL